MESPFIADRGQDLLFVAAAVVSNFERARISSDSRTFSQGGMDSPGSSYMSASAGLQGHNTEQRDVMSNFTSKSSINLYQMK